MQIVGMKKLGVGKETLYLNRDSSGEGDGTCT